MGCGLNYNKHIDKPYVYVQYVMLLLFKTRLRFRIRWKMLVKRVLSGLMYVLGKFCYSVMSNFQFKKFSWDCTKFSKKVAENAWWDLANTLKYFVLNIKGDEANYWGKQLLNIIVVIFIYLLILVLHCVPVLELHNAMLK